MLDPLRHLRAPPSTEAERPIGEVTLLAVTAVWLVLLGFGALVLRRELELLTDRVDSTDYKIRVYDGHPEG
ncbi:hypothetical protein DLJ58_21000 [Micromonospora arida]|uniref:Uncharacterized protein n=1 Tax=Micromonospora arida TaxID=2203715 RepID=A0A3N9X3K0_9ACTN|nr:hypothetical protein DLJ58_21000 [Micromonospora arida]